MFKLLNTALNTNKALFPSQYPSQEKNKLNQTQKKEALFIKMEQIASIALGILFILGIMLSISLPSAPMFLLAAAGTFFSFRNVYRTSPLIKITAYSIEKRA